MSLRLPRDPGYSVADFRQWQFERRLLENRIKEIESVAKQPTDHYPAGRLEILTALIGQLRRALPTGDVQAVRAAHAALMVGAFADEKFQRNATREAQKAQARSGGKSRGAVIAKEAANTRDTVVKWYRKWKENPEGWQEKYRSPVRFICEKTKLSESTVRRNVKKIEA